MKTINGTTEILAVFGDPIAHSLSPVMHNAAFQELNWNCVYIPCRVLPENIAVAVRAVRALGYRGVNVTIPHKQTVICELDEVFGDAIQSGSVNTIINRNGKLLGTSTDGTGFVRSLREDGNFDPAGKNIILLGAGGSAVALIFRLIAAGIKSLTVVNRDYQRAVQLKDKIWAVTRFTIEVCPLSELERLDWSVCDLLINTTSVGLYDDRTLVPSVFLTKDLFVYDIVYKRGGETNLIREAKANGCRTLSGISLLLYQGAESFRLWFEVEPPIAAMREALNRF